MRKINLFLSAIVLVSIAFISSCSKDDEPVSDHPFIEIKDDATFHGNFKSDIVVVNTQGGPVTKLEDDELKDIIQESKMNDALFVNVHQSQTKEPHLFTKTDITFDDAKKFDKSSVERLKKVVEYFKEKKKKVYVLGISFGAFMTQELIASYGIDVADGYLIMVGRLDIDEDTWKPFSEGKKTKYVYDDNGDYTIEVVDDQDVEERNMNRLAAGLGFNRYTERLKGISDLSKITYVYGTKDEQVGPLSVDETKFLEDRKAQIGKNDGANHEQAIQAGVSLINQLFK
ncbi:MAG: hypothetical protein ACPGPB_02570 [Flavobacteriaceae bacterium]